MVDLQFKCTKLFVVQGLKNGYIGGPFQNEFELDSGVVVSIISKFGKINIELTSNSPMKCDEFINIFQNIDKLLMLFDGRFYTIEKLIVSTDKAESRDILNEYNSIRLNCFYSKELYKYSWLKINLLQDVLTKDLYDKWCSLISDLDIAFQMFLYALSDNKMTIDLNFAFLVELAEPFTELVKNSTNYCQSLTPGKRRTTLKDCIYNLIVIYGTDIFANELKDDYTSFLEMVVNSRVRIMHIKKNQENFFDGNECIKYSLKFSVLYRKILLSLLDVPYQKYKENIINISKKIDDWMIIDLIVHFLKINFHIK